MLKISGKEKIWLTNRKIQNQRKKNDQLSLWLAIGIAMGAGLGIVFHNISLGVAIGLILGTSIGVAMSQKNKKV